MKTLILTVLLIPLTSFANEAYPNIGGSYNRLETSSCKGAYVLTKAEIEIASTEVDQKCSRIQDPRKYDTCSTEVYIKNGTPSEEAELLISANESNEDEDETFSLNILENGEEIYKATSSGVLARAGDKERSIIFQENAVEKSDFFVQTGIFKDSFKKSATGAIVIINLAEENPLMYQFVNECMFNWSL